MDLTQLRNAYESAHTVEDILFLIFKSPFTLQEIKKDLTPLLKSKMCQFSGMTPDRQIVYRCLTCAKSQVSCVCSKCFQESNHVGHNYFSFVTNDRFTCDCGNEFFWDKSGFCKEHTGEYITNPETLIPEKYRQCLILLPDLFQCCLHFIQYDPSCTFVNLVFTCLRQLSDVPLLFLIFSRMLQAQSEMGEESLLCTVYQRKSITLFEHYAEYCYLYEEITESVLPFLADLFRDERLIKFDLSSLFDLAFYSININHSNATALDGLFLGIVYSKDLIEKYFLESKKFDTLISNYIDWIPQFMNHILNDQEEVNLLKLTEKLFSPFCYSDSFETNEFNTENVVKLISLCSNTTPFYIDKNKSPQFDDQNTFFFFYLLLIISEFSRLVIKNKKFRSQFQMVTTRVLHHVTNFLEDVPVIEVNGVSVPRREVGVNQRVSPISGILSFYNYILFEEKECGDLNTIGLCQKDAEDLLQFALTSLKFGQQFQNDEYGKSRDNVILVSFYYNGLTFTFAKNADLNTAKLMLEFIPLKKYFALLLVMFGVETANSQHQRQEAFVNFLTIIIQMNRTNEQRLNFNNRELVMKVLAHIVAAGVERPMEACEYISLSELDLVKLFEEVVANKKKYFKKVDPLCPFVPFKIVEPLLTNTLFKNTSLKENRFYVEQTEWNIKLLAGICSEEFWSIIYKEMNTLALPYILIILTDINTALQDLSHQDEIIHLLKNCASMKEVYSYVNTNKESVFGFKEFVTGVTNKALRDILGIVTEAPKKVGNAQSSLRQKMLQRMKSKQIDKIKQDAESNKESVFIHNSGDVPEDMNITETDDSCVVCQSTQESDIGRLINFAEGIPYEIKHSKKGSYTLSCYVLSTCVHHVHESCFKRVQDRLQCPICKFQTSSFIPLSSQIDPLPPQQVTAHFSLLEQYATQHNHLFSDFLMMTLSSTLKMIVTMVNEDENTNDELIDAVQSLILATQSVFTVADIKRYLDHSVTLDPFVLYVVERLNGMNGRCAFQLEVDNILSTIAQYKKQLLPPDLIDVILPLDRAEKIECLNECKNFEDAVLQMSIEFVNTVQLYEEFGSALTSFKRNEKYDVKEFIKTSVGNSKCSSIPTIQTKLNFIELPTKLCDLFGKYSLSKCCQCNCLITNQTSCRICMLCGAPLCSENYCLIQHGKTCSNGNVVFFDFFYSAVCIMTEKGRRGMSVYYDGYGECYSVQNMMLDLFRFEPQKWNQFKRSFLKCSILYDSIMKDFDVIVPDSEEESESEQDNGLN
ncbi:hypothetical protein EIN_284100 [Entamoeba invadens IP1]|uniref:E3 ubiquitin-protein ligase n=1 Tax=Entamoeba invadens IP1 TaxID=370355 RepID=L7FKN3_ENTIV|nr:hypothetical protein EIN_284100 [Entamoeba invadens IP1]ELP84854.1 hypothetical protein EIN_284100 [Entamoeba invadens IP1]|eukprot:XP_004184200.1 hypothetical protein EIN_284100 [Entamoeba invadens IP1]